MERASHVRVLGSRIRIVAVLALLSGLLLPGAASANHSVTDLVSVGPNGGNGAAASVYRGASSDGTRVFFQTTESLVSADTDSSMDVYQRSGGTTTLLSTGPNGGNGSFSAI